MERRDSKASVAERDLGMDCQLCRVSGGWGTGQKGHEKWQEVTVMNDSRQAERGECWVLKADPRLLGVLFLDFLSTHPSASPQCNKRSSSWDSPPKLE